MQFQTTLGHRPLPEASPWAAAASADPPPALHLQVCCHSECPAMFLGVARTMKFGCPGQSSPTLSHRCWCLASKWRARHGGASQAANECRLHLHGSSLMRKSCQHVDF